MAVFTRRAPSSPLADSRRRAAVRPTVSVGAGSYGDAYTVVHVDQNGVLWQILDNDCGPTDVAECSNQDIVNRFWARQPPPGSKVKRYAVEPVPQIRGAQIGSGSLEPGWGSFGGGETDVLDMIKDFASRHVPVEPRSSSGAGDGSGGAFEQDSVATLPPVDVTAPSGVTPYSASSSAASSDASLANVQRALMKLGYSVGKTGADGKAGPSTSAAVVKFKADHGLSPVNDVVDGPFRAALTNAQVAAHSSSGSSSGLIALLAAAAVGVVLLVL